jgi:hypothetical protein
MINETIIDYEMESELSIHFNQNDELVITICPTNDDMGLQVVKLDKEDVEWIIKRLNQALIQL